MKEFNGKRHLNDELRNVFKQNTDRKGQSQLESWKCNNLQELIKKKNSFNNCNMAYETLWYFINMHNSNSEDYIFCTKIQVIHIII